MSQSLSAALASGGAGTANGVYGQQSPSANNAVGSPYTGSAAPAGLGSDSFTAASPVKKEMGMTTIIPPRLPAKDAVADDVVGASQRGVLAVVISAGVAAALFFLAVPAIFEASGKSQRIAWLTDENHERDAANAVATKGDEAGIAAMDLSKGAISQTLSEIHGLDEEDSNTLKTFFDGHVSNLHLNETHRTLVQNGLKEIKSAPGTIEKLSPIHAQLILAFAKTRLAKTDHAARGLIDGYSAGLSDPSGDFKGAKPLATVLHELSSRSASEPSKPDDTRANAGGANDALNKAHAKLIHNPKTIPLNATRWDGLYKSLTTPLVRA